MELRRYLILIRQRLPLVILAIIVGAVAGFISTSRSAHYTAVATIYVGDQNIGTTSADLYAESGLNQVVATFASMIPSSVIAQKALDKDHVNRFAGEVAASTTASVVTGTNLINVTVTDANAATAVKLTNGVANAFVAQISNYQSSAAKGTPAPGSVPNEPAYVFQPATFAGAASNGLVRKMLIGGVVGLILSILLVLLLDYLDVTIKSAEELERQVGLPVLGVIPYVASTTGPTGGSGPPVPRRPFAGAGG
jgi:capsular polysaccharide biosynthesis protein